MIIKTFDFIVCLLYSGLEKVDYHFIIVSTIILTNLTLKIRKKNIIIIYLECISD